jgi:hypothetical protein
VFRTQITICLAATALFGLSPTKTSFGARIDEISSLEEHMMKQVDEPRLESDLTYRYEYLAEFIGFSKEDVQSIHALGPSLSPRIPAMVESTYDKLLAFATTARHFWPRQNGYDGPLPEGLETLGHDVEQIQFRKEH